MSAIQASTRPRMETDFHVLLTTGRQSCADRRVRRDGARGRAHLLVDRARVAVDGPVGGNSRDGAARRDCRGVGGRSRPVVVGNSGVGGDVCRRQPDRRSTQPGHPWNALLMVSLALGMAAVLPLLLLSGVVPLTGVAVVPIVAIVLGNTMTAVSVSARLALDALKLRAGEVEAALSLGMSERDSRMEIIEQSAGNALLPILDSTRTVGLVTLPGAFVGVLLSTGSAAQAAAVQILVLIALLLSQTCGVATTIELIARGMINREQPHQIRTAWRFHKQIRFRSARR